MFIRQERSIKEFMWAYPIVFVLIIINIALWAIVYLLPFDIGEAIFVWGWGHNIAIYVNQEYWRLVTPIFLHGGLMHMVFNSFALVLFGPALEQMLGRGKFIFAYFFTGIVGNIGTYLVNPTDITPHVGASGAIYGLFGLYLFMVLFRKDLIDAASRSLLVTILILGLIMTFVQPNINIYAHIFGLIGGFILGQFVLTKARPFSVYRNRRPRPRGDGTAQFDPHRWDDNRRPMTGEAKQRLIWIIVGSIVLLGLLTRLL